MMMRVFSWLGAAVLGIVLGGASALYMAGLWPGMEPLDFGDVEVDGWVSDFAIGSEQASPYVRARVARHGLLALAKSEAVYFVRRHDDAGDPLRSGCRYRVAGGTMPAQWWSITLYTRESMLPMNEDAALSVDATNITADGQAWEAIVAPTRPADAPNWISSRNAGSFDLMLRLYQPSEALLAEPETTLTPPTVTQLDCAGEAA